MLYYHGTTKEAAEAIMKNGFDSSERVWDESKVDYIYFYKDEIDDNPREGFYRAVESAQITAAAVNYRTSKVVRLPVSTTTALMELKSYTVSTGF